MGILDEAIREHLELKRQHGADDSELKEIEDQAFGPAERPGAEDSGSDTVAEAPTEFIAQPAAEEAPAEAFEEAPSEPAERPERREPAAGMADIQEPPEPPEEQEPVEEEQPAAEHEAVPAPPAGQSTEERHAIVDQPTEMYDVEEEFEPPATAATPEIDEEQDVEDEDDFFDEQRLSDELDQALEAPSENEPEPTLHPEEEPAEEQGDDDVLGGTPDFLEESPEDDELWFEQKPPKDFDFDD